MSIWDHRRAHACCLGHRQQRLPAAHERCLSALADALTRVVVPYTNLHPEADAPPRLYAPTAERVDVSQFVESY